MGGDPEDGGRGVRLALIVAAALAATPVLARDEPAVRRGREVATRLCAACHAVERGAASPNPKAAPLASRDMRHTAGIEGRLEGLTRDGHYGMPPQFLTQKEVADLLAYIESLALR